MQKGSALLLILVVVVIVGVTGLGAYLYTKSKQSTPLNLASTSQVASTPATNPTSTWKIYTDPKNTYTIKYPPNFYLKTGDQYNPNLVEFTKVQQPSGTFNPSILGYSISVNVSPAEGKQITDFIDERLKNKIGYSQTSVKVSGMEGVKIVNGGFDWPTDSVLFIKNDQLYQILIKYFDENKDKQLEQEGRQIFEQMVSTFEFNNKPQFSETTNWKTLTTNNFSIKYPPTYVVDQRVNDLYAIVPEGVTPAPQQGISINNNYGDYTSAIEKTKSSLKNITTENIQGGVKIKGVIGPGMGEGLPIVIAIFKSNNSSIEFEKIDATIPDLTFDEILSTFRLQ